MKDFIENTLLIGAEGTKTPAGVRGRGDPAGAIAPRRLPGTPAESEVPGAPINRPIWQPITKLYRKLTGNRLCQKSLLIYGLVLNDQLLRFTAV